MGNRLTANFRSKLGLEASEKEAKKSDAERILKDIRMRYRLMTDGYKDGTLPKLAEFRSDGVISDYAELCLVDQFLSIEKNEKRHFKHLEVILEEHAIWTQWLKDIKGIGAAMAGVIISEFDIQNTIYPSGFIKYAGLDTVRVEQKDGTVEVQGRSKKEAHLVMKKYTDKKGKEQEKKSITYNPFLKTKLMGVLADMFIKHRTPKYRDIYDNYKHRLQNHPKWAKTTDGHRHMASCRYMVKLFLIDLHMKWREIEGLPVSEPYHVAKLGLVHGEVKS